MSKALLIISLFVAVLLTIFAGVASYWLWEPDVPLVSLMEWNTCDENGVVKTQFRRWETGYSWRKINTVAKAVHTKAWRIVVADSQNKTVLEYEIRPIATTKGVSERTVNIGVIPMAAPIGKYHTITYGTYALNPICDTTYELLPRITFEVIP